MSSSEITQRSINDDTLLIETGTVLDNNNAQDMVDVIDAAQRQGYKNIVMDMQHLEFLSSAGVGSILGSVETNREQGGDIILCNLKENIQHVLQVLDLAEYLTIRTDTESAMQETSGTKA